MKAILSILFVFSFSHAALALEPTGNYSVSQIQSYLGSISERTDFQLSEALDYHATVDRYLTAPNLSSDQTSMLLLLKSGLAGRLSDKLRARGGIAYAKESFKALKDAVKIAPRSEIAAKAYAMAMMGMIKNSGIKLGLIESSLGISIKQESCQAGNHLAEFPNQDGALIKTLRAKCN